MSRSPGTAAGALERSHRADSKFNGVKVIFATMVAQRDKLGERVTEWIDAHPRCKVTDIVVTQSSDAAFHCVSFTIFYWEDVLADR